MSARSWPLWRVKSWEWRLIGVTGSTKDSLPDSPPSSRIESVKSVEKPRGEEADKKLLAELERNGGELALLSVGEGREDVSGQG